MATTKPMCTSRPPQPPTSSRNRHAAGRQDSSLEARRHSSGLLRIEGANLQAVAAGIEMAKRHLELNSISGLRPEISSAFALEPQMSRAFRHELQQLQQVTARLSSLRAMDPFLEVDLANRKCLEDLVSPNRQLLESLNPAGNAIQSIAENFNRPFTEAVRSHSQMFLEATESITGALTEQANRLSSLHIPVEIYAVPRLPAAPLTRRTTHLHTRTGNGAAHQKRENNSLLTPIPERSSEIAPNADRFTDAAQTNHLLSLFNHFLESEEVSEDAKEGLTGAIAWFKLNQRRLSPRDGRKLNILIHLFLRDQQGLATPPEFQKLLSSGLLIPKPNQLPAAPELEERIYTSSELETPLNYCDSTIRKKAKAAWQKGNGPQPLKPGSEWYVVGQAAPEGGRRRGWQFRKLRRTKTPQD